MTILVVDDEPAEVERLKGLLEGVGHHVVVAATGADALRAAQDQRPYLAVIDTDLPDTSGLEVLRQIRLNPQTRGIGVVLANPNPTDDEIFFGFHYFSDFHWRRPIAAEDLLRLVGGPSLRRMKRCRTSSQSAGPAHGMRRGARPDIHSTLKPADTSGALLFAAVSRVKTRAERIGNPARPVFDPAEA